MKPAGLRHKTGRKKIEAIAAAMKTRPLAESASMNAQMPSRNPSPMPMAWYGMPKKKPK